MIKDFPIELENLNVSEKLFFTCLCSDFSDCFVCKWLIYYQASRQLLVGGKFSFPWLFGEDSDPLSGQAAICWVSAFFLQLSPLLSIFRLTVTAFTISLLPLNLLPRGFSLHSFLQLDKNVLSKTQPRHHSCATAKASPGSQAAEHLGCCLASESELHIYTRTKVKA